MNKRALILLSCFGIFLLTAVQVTTVFQPPSSAFSSAADETQTSTEETDIDLLNAAYGPSQSSVESPKIAPSIVDESTLWLARAIYSETKLPHEQELVAWVVRNRVETQYRNKETYKGVVLDPYQFSAFNPGAPRRSFFLGLTPDVQIPGWQQALWIAHYVRHADASYRPFSVQTRHFYSERSMKGRRHPYWINRDQFVSPGQDFAVNEHRFRFYKEIS